MQVQENHIKENPSIHIRKRRKRKIVFALNLACKTILSKKLFFLIRHLEKMKKWFKRFIWGFLFVFLIFNAIAFSQAYWFTHFDLSAKERPEKPENLSFISKIKVLFTGIRLPKPQNDSLPSRPFKIYKILNSRKDTLSCWKISIENPKGIVLLFHGYAGKKSDLIQHAAAFNQMGYDAFLVDFYGSGASSNSKTTIGFYEADDVKCCFKRLNRENYEKFILYGGSMGAVAIMRAVSELNVQADKIILEAPFGSLLQTVQNRFELMKVPSFPAAQFLVFWGGVQNNFNAFEHNSINYSKKIKIPTLLLSGQNDKRIGKDIQAIYQNLEGKKEWQVFENASHEVLIKRFPLKWQSVVEDFVN